MSLLVVERFKKQGNPCMPPLPCLSVKGTNVDLRRSGFFALLAPTLEEDMGCFTLILLDHHNNNAAIRAESVRSASIESTSGRLRLTDSAPTTDAATELSKRWLQPRSRHFGHTATKHKQSHTRHVSGIFSLPRENTSDIRSRDWSCQSETATSSGSKWFMVI